MNPLRDGLFEFSALVLSQAERGGVAFRVLCDPVFPLEMAPSVTRRAPDFELWLKGNPPGASPASWGQEARLGACVAGIPDDGAVRFGAAGVNLFGHFGRARRASTSCPFRFPTASPRNPQICVWGRIELWLWKENSFLRCLALAILGSSPKLVHPFQASVALTRSSISKSGPFSSRESLWSWKRIRLI